MTSNVRCSDLLGPPPVSDRNTMFSPENRSYSSSLMFGEGRRLLIKTSSMRRECNPTQKELGNLEVLPGEVGSRGSAN